MKYYKFISNRYYIDFTFGKIYRENSAGDFSTAPYQVCVYALRNSNSWEEVPEYEYFIQEKLIPDYRIPGTVLPKIPTKFKYRCALWESYKENAEKLTSPLDFISYGTKEFEGSLYILADRENYPGDNYYMFKLEDLAKLTNIDMEEEFTLPKKWKIKDCAEISKWASATFGCCNIGNSDHMLCVINDLMPSRKAYCFYQENSDQTKEYTEITLYEFKKYVLKQEIQLIGYKLRPEFEKYKKAALSICNTIGNWENSQATYDISSTQKGYINMLIGAGVLDLWFTPVYKEEKKLPIINEYTGELINSGNTIKYGCAEIGIKQLRSILRNSELSSNRSIEAIILDSGVKISLNEIKEILDFIDNYTVKFNNTTNTSFIW